MSAFLLILLSFVALGVDMAKLMATRTQLQSAADAAALAGASAFGSTTDPAVVDTAGVRALRTAANNYAFEDGPTPVVVSPGDVVVDTAEKTVTVTTRRQTAVGSAVIPHFLQVIGINQLNASAQATAQCQSTCRYMPFAVQPPVDASFLIGSTYLLKNSPPNGTQGSYWVLQFPDCAGSPCSGVGGAAQYLCWMVNGYPCCDQVKLGDCLTAEEGNMSGPTTSGIAQLIEGDTDSRLGIVYDVTHTDPNAYHGNGRRILITPLTSEVVKVGHKCYTVTGVGVFFLTAYASGSGNNNTVYGEYLGTPEEAGISPRRYSVALIR